MKLAMWEDCLNTAMSVNDIREEYDYCEGLAPSKDTKSLDLGSEGVVEMQIVAFDEDERVD